MALTKEILDVELVKVSEQDIMTVAQMFGY